MAKKQRVKKPLKKGRSEFFLLGEAKVNDYTFKIDEESSKSDWIYNVFNVAIDTGNGNSVYAEMMGGFGADRDNVVYVHGVKKNDKGKYVDDFQNRFTVDWDDRDNDEILETVGKNCFITIGLERDKKGKVVPMRFLSEYDAILYLQEHLKDGMVLNVKGNLEFSLYEGNVNMKKKINSVFLSKYNIPNEKIDYLTKKIEKLSESDGSEKQIEKLETKIEELEQEALGYKENYKATFTQSILVDKDSIGKIDKEKNTYPVDARVIDYTKLYNGKEVKSMIPLNKMFEFAINPDNPELSRKALNHIFKVKKHITEVMVEGNIVEGTTQVAVTDDDIPEDIKALIDLGYYTREEAVKSMAVGGNKEKRMIIDRPVIRRETKDDGAVTPIPQVFPEQYEEEDLFLDFMLESDEDEEEDVDIEALVDDVEDTEEDEDMPPFDVEDTEEENDELDDDDFAGLFDD